MKKRKLKKLLKLYLKCWIIVLLGISIYLIINFRISSHSNQVLQTNYFLKLTKNQFELSKKLNLIDYIETNYHLVEVPVINTDFLGKRSYEIAVEHEKEILKIPIEIEMIDTLAPIINLKEKSIELQENQLFNVHDYFTVDDNDKNIQIKIDNYDLNDGKKRILITAIDSSNNFSSQELFLNVIKNEKNILNINKENIQLKPKESSIQSTNYNVRKRFLFKDGYTMDSAYQSCYEELSKIKNGLCEPMKNQNNIFIGYKLRIK